MDTIGKMFIEESGDIRAKHFLCNRLSLAIQQGNAASILETHPMEWTTNSKKFIIYKYLIVFDFIISTNECFISIFEFIISRYNIILFKESLG